MEVDVYSADSFAVGSLRYFAAESCLLGCPSVNHDLSDDLIAGCSTGAGLDIAVVDGNFGYLDKVDNMGCCLSAVGVDIESSLGLSFDIGGGGVGSWLDSWFDNWLGMGGVVVLVGNKKVYHPNHHLNSLGRAGLQLEFHHQNAEMAGY